MRLLAWIVLFAATAGSAAAAQDVRRVGAEESPISSSVEVPMDSRLVYVSGTVPDPVDPEAPQGSARRYGDTAAQTRSVLRKIERELAEHGLGMEDIVMMRVFLVAPPGQARMDFAGMMTAYREYFGTEAQPMRPARSTMQVAGLVDPGWLVEIEVTAATPAQAARADGGGDEDGYALIDEADALNEAIGDAPPDYEFAFESGRPWAWEGGDGWLTVAEPLTTGARYYYFAPGADQPFLVRDPGYGFGYRGGEFVVGYDPAGRILTGQERAARRAAAAAQLDRARRLAAAARRQRDAIQTQRWLERRAQIMESRRRWEAARTRQQAWRDYRARGEAETRRRRLDGERNRRRDEARRFDDRQRPGGRTGTGQVTNQPPRRPPVTPEPPVVTAPNPPPATQTGNRRPQNPREPAGPAFRAAPEEVVPIGPSPAELERQRQAEAARRAETERRRQAAEQAEAARRQEQAAQAEAQRRQQEAAAADGRRRQQEAAQAEALRRQQEAQARSQAEAQARAQAEAHARAQAEVQARVQAEARAQADAQARAQAEAQAQAAARARAQAEAAALERRRQEEDAAAARQAAQQRLQQRNREVEETQPQ